jgi:CARDB
MTRARRCHPRRWPGLLIPGLLWSCVAGGEGPQGRGDSVEDPSPDLRADLSAGPILVPDQVRVDSILEMLVEVRNSGNRVAEAGWIVRVMLSTDPVIDSADIQVDHFSAPRPLPPGGEDQYLRHKKLRATTPLGLYYIGSILDVTGRIPESSEANNVLRFPARIALTAPRNGPPGGN